MKKIVIKITQEDVERYNADYFKSHPKARKKPIDKPQHPSLNWYCTANNLQVNKTKQHWKDLIVMILKDRGLINMSIESCKLIYKTYYSTMRARDLDNITPKFILDGLVHGGFIVDDNDRHIVSLTTETGYDKDDPRIELSFIILQ